MARPRPGAGHRGRRWPAAVPASAHPPATCECVASDRRMPQSRCAPSAPAAIRPRASHAWHSCGNAWLSSFASGRAGYSVEPCRRRPCGTWPEGHVPGVLPITGLPGSGPRKRGPPLLGPSHTCRASASIAGAGALPSSPYRRLGRRPGLAGMAMRAMPARPAVTRWGDGPPPCGSAASRGRPQGSAVAGGGPRLRPPASGL